MLINNEKCPFIGPSCGMDKCLFYHQEKGACIFNDSDNLTFESNYYISNICKNDECIETHESEFYIWDENKNTYEIVKWEYKGNFDDF